MVEVCLFWAGPGYASSANTFLQCWGTLQPTQWTPREHFGPKATLGHATSLVNPDHKVEDGSCILLWDFPPPYPVPCLCDTVRDKGIVHYHMARSAFMGGSQRCTSVLWTLTPWWRMSCRVQRCFPFPHCPHAKINIWYESQGTEASWIVQKVLSPFCCCCCYFFNIIFLMSWVTVYSRIKGWRRYFGISSSSSVFLLWNMGKFFCVCFGFFVYLLIWALYFPSCRHPPPPPTFLSEMEERRNCVHVCAVPCQAEKLNRQPLLLLLSHL